MLPLCRRRLVAVAVQRLPEAETSLGPKSGGKPPHSKELQFHYVDLREAAHI